MHRTRVSQYSRLIKRTGATVIFANCLPLGARGVPALRHQQHRSLLPEELAVPAGTLDRPGLAGGPAAQARLRLAAVRLRQAHVPRAPIRRARDHHTAQQGIGSSFFCIAIDVGYLEFIVV